MVKQLTLLSHILISLYFTKYWSPSFYITRAYIVLCKYLVIGFTYLLRALSIFNRRLISTSQWTSWFFSLQEHTFLDIEHKYGILQVNNNHRVWLPPCPNKRCEKRSPEETGRTSFWCWTSVADAGPTSKRRRCLNIKSTSCVFCTWGRRQWCQRAVMRITCEANTSICLGDRLTSRHVSPSRSRGWWYLSDTSPWINVGSTLVQCRDAGPTLSQHWFNVLCLLVRMWRSHIYLCLWWILLWFPRRMLSTDFLDAVNPVIFSTYTPSPQKVGQH